MQALEQPPAASSQLSLQVCSSQLQLSELRNCRARQSITRIHSRASENTNVQASWTLPIPSGDPPLASLAKLHSCQAKSLTPNAEECSMELPLKCFIP